MWEVRMLKQKRRQPHGVRRKVGVQPCQGGVALVSAQGFNLRPPKDYALIVRATPWK